MLLASCGDPAGQDSSSLRRGEADHYAHAVSHILIRVEKGGGNEAESRKRIYDIFAELENGVPFEKLAKTHSQHGSAGNGGFIGFVPTDPDTRFSGAIQALAPGQTSQPVRTDLGYQIIHRHPLDEAIAIEQKLMYAAYGFILPYEGVAPDATLTHDEARKVAARVYREAKAGRMSLAEARDQFTRVPPNSHPEAFLMVTADMPDREELVERLRSVEPGEYVEPYETPSGIALVRRGQMVRGIVRHIIVKHARSLQRPIHVNRIPAEARRRAEQALSELKADKSNWDALVQKYTDDDTSRRPRGTVGLVGPGELTLAIEDVFVDMKPGEVYPEVLESPYGFHVIWRVR